MIQSIVDYIIIVRFQNYLQNKRKKIIETGCVFINWTIITKDAGYCNL